MNRRFDWNGKACATATILLLQLGLLSGTHLQSPRTAWETRLLQTEATASEERFATLESIEFWSLTDSAQIILSLDREVKFKAAALTDPERIYLDLFSTVVRKTFWSSRRQVQDPLLQTIRVAQNGPAITRVVLDLTERTTYRISSVPDENRLIVELSRKDNRRSPLQAMQEQNPRGLVEVLDVRFETRGEQTEVILELSEPRDPVAERLSNPPRLYFDFPESYVGRDLLRNIDVNDARVRRIRVRQNRADTVRLVLDLASAVQYRTEWREDSKRWVVHIFR